MWTNEPLTIEKRGDGIWHTGFIQPDGALLTRTTVLPREAGGSLAPAGWTGATALAADMLDRAAGSLPDAEDAARHRAAAASTREWLSQFPAPEDAGRSSGRLIGIEPNGRIVSPQGADGRTTRLTTAGRIRNFRSGLRPRGGVPTVFEAWRATPRPSQFVAAQLLARQPCEAGWDSARRLGHEDQWYETLVQWWEAAEARGAIRLHPGGIWALDHEYTGPANPITVP